MGALLSYGKKFFARRGQTPLQFRGRHGVNPRRFLRGSQNSQDVLCSFGNVGVAGVVPVAGGGYVVEGSKQRAIFIA